MMPSKKGVALLAPGIPIAPDVGVTLALSQRANAALIAGGGEGRGLRGGGGGGQEHRGRGPGGAWGKRELEGGRGVWVR